MVKGALIGCGFFAHNHIQAWRQLENVEIVAVCDLDPARARSMAEAYGIERWFADLDALLAAIQPDFVDIATTAPSHPALVCKALAAGVAVICQKPFAESMDAARTMVAAAEQAGLPLLVHENFRWERPLLELQRRLADGLIGTRRFAHLSFRHAYPDLYRNQPYLAEIERFAILDVGLHLFDVVRWLMGEVDNLFCRTQRLRPDIKGEDSFAASLRHADGGVSLVDCSFDSHLEPDPFPQTAIRVEGSKGTLELTRDYHLIVQCNGTRQTIDVEPEPPAWGAKPWHCVQDSVIAIQRHWLDVLAGKAQPQPSGGDNLRTMQLAFAAYESAAQDIAVDIRLFIER